MATNLPSSLVNILRRIQGQEPAHTGNLVISAALETTIGQVPFIGNTLQNIFTEVIGPARISRVGVFCQSLASKITPDTLKISAEDPEGIELLEEGIVQSSRANSRERIEHIADLVVSGLSGHELQRQRGRHFLRVLSQLDDSQIIILLSYSPRYVRIGDSGTAAFFEKHKAILGPFSRAINSDGIDLEKANHKEALERHLSSFGLLEVEREDLGTWDGQRAADATIDYRITPQGLQFLRFLRLEE